MTMLKTDILFCAGYTINEENLWHLKTHPLSMSSLLAFRSLPKHDQIKLFKRSSKRLSPILLQTLELNTGNLSNLWMALLLLIFPIIFYDNSKQQPCAKII